MPPKTQISKERILETGLQILIREGYASVTIHRLAKELNCSTQPISWTFGSMEGFRSELALYTLRYFNGKIEKRMQDRTNPLAAFSCVGESYLQVAFEEPNIVRFVRANSALFVSQGGLGSVFDYEKSKELRQALTELLGICDEEAGEFMKTMVVFSQGLVAMVVDKTIDISLDEGVNMLRETGVRFLAYAGVDENKARQLLNLKQRRT